MNNRVEKTKIGGDSGYSITCIEELDENGVLVRPAIYEISDSSGEILDTVYSIYAAKAYIHNCLSQAHMSNTLDGSSLFFG